MEARIGLAELLAVRLSAPEFLNAPEFWAMGTFVDPGTVITPFHILSDIGASPSSQVTVHYEHRMSVSTIPIEQTLSFVGIIFRTSQADDLGIIGIAHETVELSFPDILREDFIASSIPPAESSWESYLIIPAAPDGIHIYGIVEGLEMIGEIAYLRLRMTEYPRDWEFERWRGISGAPIVIEDKLYGIIGRMHTSEPVLYALPPSAEIGARWRHQLTEQTSGAEEPVRQNSPMWEEFSPENFLRHLSPESQRAIARADELRRAGKQRTLYAEYLWIALAEQPDDRFTQFLHAHDSNTQSLIEQVITTSDMSNSYAPGAAQLKPLTSLPRLTEQLSKAFLYAYDLAYGRGSNEIETSSLLAGLLSVGNSAVTKMLGKQGITLESLLQFLASEPSPEEIPVEEIPLDSSPVIPGLRNDQVGDKDLLDISSEAMTLASVIAAREVSPPFSIGLFGEWGSGKTFFMGEMERSIKRLVKEANDNSGQSPYCTNIVQIWFNSWHYIDTDLWASLTSEIFEGLATAFSPTRPENDKEILEKLIADKSRTTDILAETTQKLETARRELQQNEERITELNSDNDRLKNKLDSAALVREAVRYAANQPEVREKIRMAADAIGDDVMKQNASEIAQDLPELLKETSKLGLVWSSLGSTRNILLFLLWMIVVGGIIAAAVFLLPAFIASDLWRVVTGLVASALATYQLIRPITRGARQALKYFNQANEAREKFIAEEEQKQRTELETKRNQKQKEIDSIQAKVDQLKSEIASSTEDLKELGAAARLSSFIGERDKSDDYRKHLGVITKTRNDFERLGMLMKRVREQKPEDLADHPEMKEFKVDRVVLYIDDLDRCPEHRVVEVLQAVHLLLAFDPFIVVVGVDPRWLLRALKQHTKIFEIERDDSGGGEDYEHSHWQSTPMNYLEKIFQIPFSLRPMGSAGFDQLIDSLAAPMAASRDQAALPVAPAGSQQPATGTASSQQNPQEDPGKHTGDPARSPENSPARAPGTENTADQNQGRTNIPPPVTAAQQPDPAGTAPKPAPIPRHLTIEPWELEGMKKLYDFIPSPRALKRFVNIYRLLRTSVAEKHRRTFIGNTDGGMHRPALLLLAIQTGHPEEAATIIQALLNETETPGRPWWELIEALCSQHTAPSGSPAEARPSRGGRMSAERWSNLSRKLGAFRDRHPSFIGQDHGCGDFIALAPDVARYSFHSGRVVAAEPAQQQPA